ncbi:MAG: exodeoxyribonuclease VII large subunit [Bacteroidales bacterium]|nr:exodeoxyribonuclease VII large subunit [Bacteroidales bacterium]
MPAKHISLYELNSLVSETLELTLNDSYWMVAELSEVRVAANGHCYVEFVEKNPKSNALVAKAHGNIWRNVYQLLAPYFRKTTGESLAPGMKVLVQVSVTFHELYGYSLNVTDIDPTYTMGEVARRRQEIIAQLTEDGVLTLNKELPLPRPLRRVAVISSSTAAGYGDFCNQLAQSGFPFETKLFQATMQGDRVEQSVIAALDAIAQEADNWDVVAIIRGGGAVSDLNGFETYLLAANVAQFPLPVLTGIGHERDDTVIDDVAHTRLKTPTAVAAFLIEARRGEVDLIDGIRQRLDRAARNELTLARRQLEQTATRFHLATTEYGNRQRAHLAQLQARTELFARQQLQAARFALNRYPDRLTEALTTRLMRERHRLELADRSIKLAGPERILNMGFSITLKDGKAVRDAALLKPGDRLTTRFAKGGAEVEVTSTSKP